MATLALVAALAGCSAQHAPGYYTQAALGQLRLLQAAQPLPDWLAREDLAPPLRQRLELAQRARRFAVQELALPDNTSYTRYARLSRSAAVWNVVAAPRDGLQLHAWCFPIAGCVGYRGYFNEADARAQADHLAARGWDVHVYGVPAYSTLGYLNWLGGDPLLSSFIAWPEGDFVGLLFHELAHQVLYVAGDTAFNESFATAVQHLGTARWLEQAEPAARTAHAASEARRQGFRTLTRRTRAALAQLYSAQQAQPLPPATLEAGKQALLAGFRADYAQLRADWVQAAPAAAAAAATHPWALTDRWVAEANNASFAALAAYDDWTTAFEALFHQQGGDWPAFYAAVRALSQRPPAERTAALCALLPADGRAAVPADCLDTPKIGAAGAGAP